ncbi:prolyl oligopeptidase family serine peptidase [Mucilaginibacter sp. RS28]|uniref:Prolyl oligopeptidase family serine peptidase n=1 Tax=Mucilaginibacter straminoryzae TaxID=2932774 RepID=A0A9X2B8D7_9SPHI|nr:prolyl oligopeptidase family serine peptidase [Mucilaginibacter straminoryzae]MCJ8209519.1 prolyl oligopeptidase family serine peptidase [Mucilaginibacter straminoryzae]
MTKKLYLYLLLLLPYGIKAQDAVSYQMPPKEMADLLLAKPTPGVSIDSRAEWMLLSDRNSYPSVEELARPELRIAGLRINPNNFALSRQNFISGFTLKNIKTGQSFPVVGLPSPLFAGIPVWNTNETKIAFTQTTAKGVDIYVIDVATHKATKMNKRSLNTVLNSRVTWTDANTLQYYVATAPASAAPAKPAMPKGPVVQQNLGKAAPSATYEDLIKSPYDEQLFEFYATSQLVRNKNGLETAIGKPQIYSDVTLSPDKKYMLVRTLHKPFSYLVTAGGFPSKVEIEDVNGKAIKTLANLPSAEGRPSGYDNVQNIPRSFDWRDDEPATITWAMPLDSGMIRKKVDYHDAVYALNAPFSGEGKELFKTQMRYRGVQWGNATVALISEGLRSKQQSRVSRFNPTSGTVEKLYDRNETDAYNALGFPVTQKNKYDRDVIATTDNGKELLYNNPVGASPKGDLPFLAKYNLETKKSEIIWRCEEGFFESVVDVVNPTKLVIITRRESKTEVPNYFIRDFSRPGSLTAITKFANPYPQLVGVSKQKIKYKRADGIDLTADLYLPKGYNKDKDGPLPVLIWAYPREFNSANDAAQVRGSENRFTTIGGGSPVYFVTNGYAILDNAEMPIVAKEGKKPNDTFVEQLQLNAEAAINKLAEMGVGDRNRIAVGGHSYGAFMTANLLAHTNLFKAGIAESGAYNRTLTPFGFQNEERTYWDDPKLYYDMSPFSFANKIKTPLLLIHGDADDNPGTFPINSERLFNAIKGFGGTVRFVFLPYEAHGYRGRENLLHKLWEINKWMDTYVKNAKPAAPASTGN